MRAAGCSLAVIVALLTVVEHTPARSLCRIWSFHSTRHGELTHFLATALPDTLDAGPASPPRSPVEAMSASSPPGMERVPRSGDKSHWGQLVRLDRVGGHGTGELEALRARGVQDAVLVPWGYAADCRPEGWEESARWVTPGASGFFTALLRPPSQWVRSLPTFDVATAWHQPYPHGQFLQYDRPDPPTDSLPRLTAAEYYELYEALPPPSVYETNRSAAPASLRAWARAHPELARRYPATEVIRMVEHLASSTR